MLVPLINPFPIEVNEFVELKVIDCNLLPLKALVPISLTELGIVIVVNPDLLNASEPILVGLDGQVKLVNAVQPENPWYGI